MSEPLTVSYMFDDLHLKAGLRWHCRQWWNLGVAVAISPFVFLSPFVLKGWFCSNQEMINSALNTMFKMGCLGLGIWALSLPILWRLAIHIGSQQAEFGQKVSWSFASDIPDLAIDSTHTSIPWQRIYRTISTPEGMLMYLLPGRMHWLPKSAFAINSDFGRLKDLFAAKTRYSELG